MKYKLIQPVNRAGILLFFFFVPFFIQAQNSERDTVLKYELDTTIVPVFPAEDPPAEDKYSQEANEENTGNEEYFLKKEFAGGFADTLKLRQLPDSVMRRLRDDDAFWYANAVFKKKQPRQAKGFASHPVVQTLLWVAIIAGFATFLIMYLSNSNVGLFRKSNKIMAEDEGVDTDDIFVINYQKEIDKAIGMNNYRLAVRLLFLRLLKKLSDSNVIQYKQDRTNLDYLLQLQPTAMYADFFRLTRSYEYSWYGQFDIDKEKFDTIKVDFDKFERKIK